MRFIAPMKKECPGNAVTRAGAEGFDCKGHSNRDEHIKMGEAPQVTR